MKHLLVQVRRPVTTAACTRFRALSACNPTKSPASTPRRWQHDASSESSSDLFNYTSGRWIHDEPHHQSKRRRPFNVPELKRLAASALSVPATEVSDLRKLGEGGFNRTFLLTLRDGLTQLVARIPYPATEPKYLSVASEVATLEYLRRRGFPVPRVLGYDATSDNAAGTEYIFMEVAPGRCLRECWAELTTAEMARVVERIVALEARLMALEFPVAGSLFLEQDLRCMETVRITDPCTEDEGVPEEEKGGQFCVGPDVSRGLWLGKRRILPVHRGPYTSPVDVMTAGARKEIVYLEEYGQPVRTSKPLPHHPYKQSPREYIDSLTNYLRVAPSLVPNDPALTRNTIRHPDLQPSNIFVSDDLEITGLIDWQYTTIRPLFLQCGVPANFQSADGEIPSLLHEPTLPAGFERLSEADQMRERELFRSRQLHYFYLTATAHLNPLHQAALTCDLGVLRRSLCHQAAAPWDGDNVTLKADLIQLGMNWDRIARPEEADSTCPIEYGQEEVSECLQLNNVQVEMEEQERLSREALGVGSEGWVSPERYEDVKACEDLLKAVGFNVGDSRNERVMA
ncbi:aminoglycoside phosphotransferase family protein [Aspergillus homomorphus CBS 101889]|uniref:Phosphotransferase n=1 Tax=Aspergillus homomorphus (strain CBS 101889) TaxID=1450537 RepID=A0A395HZM8_ASPHC|nr:phosphotransferase [Aspergillus homomorphus CBS 101889]RAL13147.1 phosphotransferase [Aspergillus homomorphus CBS 101889]